MANPWFRLYSEHLNDPKVQNLSSDLFKIWINTLCLACNNNGTLPNVSDCSFALRLPFHETKTAFHQLENLALLVTDGETFQVRNWNKRQYKSDTSTDRVKRWRKQKRNVTVTAPDTDTDTDTEKEKIDKKENVSASRQPKAKGFRLSEEWELPSEWGHWALKEGLSREEVLKQEEVFKDYWIAKPGQQGIKLNWEATWRNWIRKSQEFKK